MAPCYIGLIHYPIYNKHMEVITTALTNYDLHDIARTARTYDVRTYFIIHPVEAQRRMASLIMEHWKTGAGSRYNPNRREAFEETALVPDLAAAVAQIEKTAAKSRRSSPPMPGSIPIRSPTPECAGRSAKGRGPCSSSSAPDTA